MPGVGKATAVSMYEHEVFNTPGEVTHRLVLAPHVGSPSVSNFSLEPMRTVQVSLISAYFSARLSKYRLHSFQGIPAVAQ